MPESRNRANSFPTNTVTKAQVEEIAKDKKKLGCTDVEIFEDTVKKVWVLVYTLPEPL